MHAPTAVSQSTSAFQTSAPVSVTNKPVAKVNGTVLTDRDLVREMMVIFPYAQQHGGRFPKEMEPGIRKGALDMIIFEELVYQDAERRKVTVPCRQARPGDVAIQETVQLRGRISGLPEE